MSKPPAPVDPEQQKKEQARQERYFSAANHIRDIIIDHGFVIIHPDDDKIPGIFCNVVISDIDGRLFDVDWNIAKLETQDHVKMILRVTSRPPHKEAHIDVRASMPPGEINFSDMSDWRCTSTYAPFSSEEQQLLDALSGTHVHEGLTRHMFELSKGENPQWVRKSAEVPKLLGK